MKLFKQCTNDAPAPFIHLWKDKELAPYNNKIIAYQKKHLFQHLDTPALIDGVAFALLRKEKHEVTDWLFTRATFMMTMYTLFPLTSQKDDFTETMSWGGIKVRYPTARETNIINQMVTSKSARFAKIPYLDSMKSLKKSFANEPKHCPTRNVPRPGR